MLVIEQVLPIPLSDAKRAELRTELADVAIEIDRHDEVLTAHKDVHKEATQRPKKRMMEIKRNIRQGFIEERRRVHEFVNDEDATIEYVDAETAESLMVRDLTLEERTQYKIPFNVGRNKRKKGKTLQPLEGFTRGEEPGSFTAN